MILKKLKIKNIRSYKEAEIEFPEGSTLLMGDIGSGKTSILLAIEFALFGLQPNQRGNSLLRSNEDEAFVSLELEIDNKKVLIERTITKSGKSITQSSASVKINEDYYEGSVTEIKNRILSILSYPQEFAKKTNDLYKFTVYTPQEEMKQIIMESNDTRLNTLRHIFGIDKYKRIEENVDILTTRLRQEIRINEDKIGGVELRKRALTEKSTNILVINKQIIEIENEISKIQTQKLEKQKEIDELTKKINEKANFEKEKAKTEVMLLNKNELIMSYEKEIFLLKKQIIEIKRFSFKESEIDDLKVKIKSNELALKSFEEAYIPLVSSIQTIETRKRELENVKNKISGLNKCPTCLQDVNESYKKTIINQKDQELSMLDLQKSSNIKMKEELMQKIEQTKKQINAFKNALSETEILRVKLQQTKEKEERMEYIERQKNSAIKDIEILKRQTIELEKVIAEYRRYSEIFDYKNKELQKIISGENKLLINRAELKKEVQFLEIQIKDIENEIKELEKIAEKISYLKEIEFWINNKFIDLVLYTERNVMLKLREEFSDLFSNWFSILVSDSISVRLDESFSPVIQQNDYEVDYNYLSGGERTAIALAYRLALNQVINSLLSKIKTKDLVILDEPTDGFSDSQLDKMRDIFQQLKVRQLILVSHEPKIEGFVDNIIRFKKVGGISEIEKG
jgi:exonuclease SbcC